MAISRSLATHLFAGLMACLLASWAPGSAGAEDLADLLAGKVYDSTAEATESAVDDYETSTDAATEEATDQSPTDQQVAPAQSTAAGEPIDIAAFLVEVEGEELPGADLGPSNEATEENGESKAAVKEAEEIAKSDDSDSEKSEKEEKSTMAPSTELSINRPISLLTVDPATRGELTERMGKLKPAYQIQSPASQTFGDWWAPLFDVAFQPARYAPQGFCWAAPSVYHRPLHFEEPNLERYGHYVALVEDHTCLQSAVSAAHFFGSLPLMPYKLGADPCWERHYVLGCYRPGTCNPHQLIRPELSARGLLYQGLFTTGAVFVTP